MSSPNHPTSNIEDALSLNFPDYLLASSDYVPASPGKTYFSSSNSFGLLNSNKLVPKLPNFKESKWEVTIRLLLLDLEFPISNKSLKKSKLVTKMPPKRNSASAASASEAPAMTQAAIRQLVVDSVATAPETQAVTMANADNANRNPEPRESTVAKKCSYKEFMSCQPFNFKGSEGAVGLICWFERTESVFSRSNCIKDCKDRRSYKITWVEFKKLLIKMYYPWTEIQKMEDEFYHLTVKGNDLKTYVRRFQELGTLCPTMVSDSEKLLEAFIRGLPRSIKGNVTASRPQTLEEAINIAQRLMDQYHAKILCDEKVVHIPIDGETLIIRVMEKKSDEKRLEDIPVVKEFLDVFPEDLPGLPPVRQVEF
uniref:Reverse transcriptase domain-containing protein n=1 Tax=Tanacetum cinerariifolium TaxID=118510 RepID=A0A6L2M9E1_TANCI|nr:reverse transcriptase domain-containing protein [Tanacetum cinerariifolium]